MQIDTIIRICSTDKQPLPFNKDGHQEGWICHDLYYCSQKCLDASFEGTGETWSEHYSDDSDCYFSEWELEEI